MSWLKCTLRGADMLLTSVSGSSVCLAVIITANACFKVVIGMTLARVLGRQLVLYIDLHRKRGYNDSGLICIWLMLAPQHVTIFGLRQFGIALAIL